MSISNALMCLENKDYLCETPHTVARVLSQDFPAIVERNSIALKATFLEISITLSTKISISF